MTVHWLSVDPLDTIMVRDGRRFDAGVDGRAVGTAPPPSTFGGALHTALDRRVGEVLGAVVVTENGPIFPPPADLVVDDEGPRRLAVLPRDTDLGWDLDERHQLSHVLAGDGDPIADRWITANGLAAWLRSEPPLAQGEPVGDRAGLVGLPWTPEPRLGLARHWDGELVGTARRGLLYSMSHMRPGERTRFLVPVEDDRDLELVHDVVPLGGRGRVAHIEVTTPEEAPLPVAPDAFPGGRVSVYLATPALVGRHPDGRPSEEARADVWWAPEDATLCALALPAPMAVATATNRNGQHRESRRLTWAMPAGTVFYLRFDSEGAAGNWARDHHGRLLPGLSNSPLRTAGFGMCLTGSW